jgi:hypothetical protein
MHEQDLEHAVAHAMDEDARARSRRHGAMLPFADRSRASDNVNGTVQTASGAVLSNYGAISPHKGDVRVE